MDLIGGIAAIATSFFFAITAIIFTRTANLVSAQVTNRIRLVFAVALLVGLNSILFREPLPFSAGSFRWMWLGLSGIIGLSIGDAFLFRSMVSVGTRLGILLMSLAPIFGSLIAWVFFGETLTLTQIFGIVVALGGIAWVVLAHEEPPDTPRGHTASGIFFGVLGALGQAVGLVLAKQGMVDEFDPFKATAIRMLAALTFTWIWTVVEGKAGVTLDALREKPRAIPLLALGSLMGPLLGVSASLLAIQHAEIGVASTLMALPPVILLPISYFGFKERITWPAAAGTCVAIAGVAILFLA
jgi:uncharacterized membrane protein